MTDHRARLREHLNQLRAVVDAMLVHVDAIDPARFRVELQECGGDVNAMQDEVTRIRTAYLDALRGTNGSQGRS